jgi:hypothetical protein
MDIPCRAHIPKRERRTVRRGAWEIDVASINISISRAFRDLPRPYEIEAGFDTVNHLTSLLATSALPQVDANVSNASLLSSVCPLTQRRARVEPGRDRSEGACWHARRHARRAEARGCRNAGPSWGSGWMRTAASPGGFTQHTVNSFINPTWKGEPQGRPSHRRVRSHDSRHGLAGG